MQLDSEDEASFLVELENALNEGDDNGLSDLATYTWFFSILGVLCGLVRERENGEVDVSFLLWH